jgi:hypothetical protein
MSAAVGTDYDDILLSSNVFCTVYNEKESAHTKRNQVLECSDPFSEEISAWESTLTP